MRKKVGRPLGAKNKIPAKGRERVIAKQVRFTPDEWEQTARKMEDAGFKNFAAYFRSRFL